MKLSEEQQRQITKLYADHFVPLLFYAKSVLRDMEAAEEAVQKTFRIACTKADQLLKSPNPEGWLILTLKNTLRNRTRISFQFRRIFSPLSLDDAQGVAAKPPNDLDFMIQLVLTPDEYALYRQVIVCGETIARIAQDSSSFCRRTLFRAPRGS